MSRQRRRFLIDEAQMTGAQATVTGAQFHHAARVLRLKPGDAVTLFTRAGTEYSARIRSVGGGQVTADIVAPTAGGGRAAFELTVIQGLLKSGAMDLAVQKCAELGAHDLIAAQMTLSTARLDAKGRRAKAERWQKIADRAAEQSSSARAMRVSIAPDLAAALEQAGAMPVLALHEEEKERTLREAIKRLHGNRSLAVVIGPEGGLDQSEVEVLGAAGALFAGLGAGILRAETAAMAACAIIMYELGAENDS